jgi:hypothetical protein
MAVNPRFCTVLRAKGTIIQILGVNVWRSHEHATHYTTPPDAFPDQGIIYARPLNKARYGYYIEGYDRQLVY